MPSPVSCRATRVASSCRASRSKVSLHTIGRGLASAGQSYDEAVRIAKRIAEIPEVFGSAVLLVDHDMDLVRAACASVTVFDYGKVIASGPTAKVLDLAAVKTAYLGIDETEAA